MKLRKILSLVLVVTLLCSVALIGSVSAEATAVVKEDGNYLLNGSFELAETRENGCLYGFKNYCVNHGGTSVLVDNWQTFNWLNGNSAAQPNIKITHTNDAHSGDYALYFDIPYSNTHYVYPTALAVDTLPAGNYRLTAWVKGTNSASTINVTDADGNTKKVNVVASEDWTQISIDGITSIGKVNVNGKDVIGITITPKKGDAESYFIIDDIRLEAVETEVKLLSYGSFDTADTLWNSAAGKNGMTGYTDFAPANGQNNSIVDGWRYLTWINSSDLGIHFDHTTDAHSGNYALKANIQSTDQNITIHPSTATLNSAAVTEGYYTLSVWVKSTNNSANTRLEVKSTVTDSDTAKTYTTPITYGEDWHKVSLYDIYLTDGAANLATYEKGYFIKIILTADKSVSNDTYVILDDITLEKQDVFYNGGMEIKGNKDTNVTTNGQANPNTILQGFTMQDWSGAKTKYDIIDDAHSGDKALKITTATSCYVYARYDGNEIGAGTYKLSAWVKGNASDARFRTYYATESEPTTLLGYGKYNYKITDLSETEWKYYEYVFTISNGYVIRRFAEQNGSSYSYQMGFGMETAVAGDYAIFDDVKLEKLDDAATVAASIIGIDTPEKGATSLTLPKVDSNITLSIVASSDENVVALDGTITPTAGRNIVDITLEVSDGKNTVVLEPIGVVIPGTNQVAIDDVKREIKLLPNDNEYPILPIHFNELARVRAMYNELSADAQVFVTNAFVLGQRENTMDTYAASIGNASLSKDGQLRVKAAYPTKFADGYKVKEYGMLFIPTVLADNENITLDTANVSASVMDFVPTEADTYFYSVLKDSALENHKNTEILMRSYVTYEYVENDKIKTVTVYSRYTVKSSVADLMAQ